jgi:hypothetical protein
VVSSADPQNPISKLKPWAIEAGIKGIAGIPKSFKKLRSGDLLIEIDSRPHCQNLLNSAALVNVPIKVSPHRLLNFSRGVVRCREFDNCTEDDILEGLEDQGVIKVRCCKRRNEHGEMERTGTYFLDFNTPDLPSEIKVCFEIFRIKHYIPNPLRCYKCQKYGHSKTHCRRNEVCAKCSEENHSFENCPSNIPKCANCSGPHYATDKNCPQWITEKEIQAYKTKNNVSFKEARNIVHARTPGGADGKSYAAAAQPVKKPEPRPVTKCTSSTQTSSTFPSPLFCKPSTSQQTEGPTETNKTVSCEENTFAKVVSSPEKVSKPACAVAQAEKPSTNMTVLKKKETRISKIPGPTGPKKNTPSRPKFTNFTGGTFARGSRYPPVAVEGKKGAGKGKSSHNLKSTPVGKGPTKQKPPNTKKKKDEPVADDKMDTSPSQTTPTSDTRTEQDNSSIYDSFEGFGQVVMDRQSHSKPVPIPLKRDNKLPT